MATNGELLAPQDLVLQIKWTPSNGSVSVAFPQVDHVSILGMLEFAKVSLLEMRAKNDQRVVVPDLRILNGNKLT